jgi:hypothetical protein
MAVPRTMMRTAGIAASLLATMACRAQTLWRMLGPASSAVGAAVNPETGPPAGGLSGAVGAPPQAPLRFPARRKATPVRL